MSARAATGHEPGTMVLWYGLFGAPLAWSLQLVVAYGLVSVSCGAAMHPSGNASPLRLGAAIAVSSVALIGAAGALWIAVRSWRTVPGEDPGSSLLARATRDRIAFMAFSGIFVSTVFTIGVVFAAAGMFFLDPCG